MSHNQRVAALDGMRAIAILLVIWSHVQRTSYFPSVLAPERSWDGSLGVRIFFVISGFLITRLMLDEEARTGTVCLRAFYRRRCVRILPAFWCYIACIAVLWLVGILPLKPLPDLLQPLTFTNGFWFWHAVPFWQTAHSWSLAIEEQFYLLWPIAFLLLGPRRRRPLMLALLLFLGPILRMRLIGSPWLIWTIAGNFDMLGWGCFLAVAMQRYPTVVRRITAWMPALGRLLALVLIGFAPGYLWRILDRIRMPLAALPLAVSVQAAAIAYLIGSLMEIRRGALHRVLVSPIFAGIGICSYSLYLWQQPFLHHTIPSPWWQAWPANLACAFAMAVASYRLIERPLFRFKRKRPAESAISASESTIMGAAPVRV